MDKNELINIQDEDGKTLLHYAVLDKNLEVTTWLLERTSPKAIRFKDNTGKEVMDYAREFINKKGL